jgi:amino acid adenylation domain-containing protein
VRAESRLDGRRKHDASGQDLAYLLFTSGTTGLPKGVAITHANANHYVQAVLDRYQPTPEDRFSQVFDLTFDLSVHDMFMCWAAGATLHVPPDSAVMAPTKFIRKNELTFWFSVPSVIPVMNKLRMLPAGAFPSLRTSLFCGEALPVASAASWQEAAPNSIVENLYGPTEATIAFTFYRWLPEYADRSFEAGLVPIGRPFPGLDCVVLDAHGRLAPEDEIGELALGGPQLSPGYWKDEARTAEKFIGLDCGHGRPSRWYRTGDLAQYDSEAGYVFRGRVDSQVKIMGYRVELGEIEQCVRNAAETDLVVAVPWPRNEGGGASGVIAFVCGSGIDAEAITSKCTEELAPYMVPSAIYNLESFPLNSNGKVDRGALARRLEEDNV